MKEIQEIYFNGNLIDGGYTEKVLQFGEGNFLRGFVDWMINKMNQQGLFNGKVVVVQPIERGMADALNRQNGLYTLLLRGIQDGRKIEESNVIFSISRGINPYIEYAEYLSCAENPDLRFIISNTTEAGIAYHAGESLDDQPQTSFPGKLTAFLYRRFRTFDGDPAKGLVMIPCELIDRNGDNLKETVMRLAREWGLEHAFISWLEKDNYFLNTLVDRIVSGYPKEEINQLTQCLGYNDNLLNTAEVFHLWVIEGDKKLSSELPLAQAGLNVIWTDDLTPYRTRKVRILNGAHTMTVLAAYLYGKDTVKECVDDPLISNFMQKGIYGEIIPSMDLPEKELKEYASSVLERFANPFIKHNLLNIALNSVSKFKTRILPSLLGYIQKKNTAPKILTFALASLIAFYRGIEKRNGALIGRRPGNDYPLQDDEKVLDYFQHLWKDCDGSYASLRKIASNVLSCNDFWGTDLSEIPELTHEVTKSLNRIINLGMAEAIQRILDDLEEDGR